MFAHPSQTDSLQAKPMPSQGVQPMTSIEALAVAKAHFTARGWRPMSIQSPDLAERCADVSATLLMNDAGGTAWLSARDWSALPNPVDAFRREMICVRSAKVQEVILVHDGDFPEAVVEIAAREPGMKLVDAVALRSMSDSVPPSGVHVPPMSRRERFVRPARNAVASLHAQATRAVDSHLLPATERFVSKRLAQRLRQMDGERRKLRNLVTGGLVVMGFAVGFLMFNLVVLLRAPEEAPVPRMAQAARPMLPTPLPPAEGYVAQAADVGAYVPAFRTAGSPQTMSPQAIGSSIERSRATSRAIEPDVVATSATVQPGLDDYALAQMRADEAMRVIADDTPEIDAASRMAASWRRSNAIDDTVASNASHTADPAMVGGATARPDPAGVD